MIPLMAFIIGAFCGASIMWWISDREARHYGPLCDMHRTLCDMHFAEWVNEPNKRASEWLRRGQS